eukprot:Hpha_TRINITY_DN10999_c0_g1::TRINITY_DN10999_c0_g1_i1::g.26739::m.26739/K11209/yghU, yfcG; GSH-dependent disulfide-bond oxidoreductase
MKRLTVLASHVRSGPESGASGASGDSFPPGYRPPKVWSSDSGVDFGSVRAAGVLSLNSATAGARKQAALPEGSHGLQLYSLGTPNGQKVTILLEELHDLLGVEYDAYTINIAGGKQFDSGFVEINPNSKIPALVDKTDGKPVRVFESGSILVHLAEKYGRFLPTERAQRTECFNWLMWQMGSAPTIGGGFGHFFAYAPVRVQYAVDRYAMETKRLIDVADRHLATNKYFCGDEYTIADMAIFPWLLALFGGGYKTPGGSASNVFLSTTEYKNVARWIALLKERPAVRRGLLVNRPGGGLVERHSAADFQKLSEKVKKKAGLI